MNIPNVVNINEILNSLEKEIDLPSRLKRYKTATPELLDFANEHGLTDPDIAVYALFVADFIVTASEVPMGSTDESRRISVINTFNQALRSRSSSPEGLMKVFYLAYKLAVIMRRQLLFMTSRGLELHTSLLRIHDSYLIPYLAVTNELLGRGSTSFDLGVLSAAVNRQYPDEELRLYEASPPFEDFSGGVTYRWKMMTRFGALQNPEINTTKTIPNINESQCILFPNTHELKQASFWNLTVQRENELRTNTKPLIDFLNQKDQEQPLYYLRGHVAGTDERIILVRDPTLPNKPLFILKTPANEINLTQILPILELRGREASGWLKIELTEQSSPIVDEPSSEQKIKQQPRSPEKQGFFAKIKRFFGFKKDKLQAIPSRATKKKPSKQKQYPNFLSHGITVDSVGDIPLFEMFDTLRESEYVIVGSLESDFTEKKTQIFTETSYLSPETILDVLNGLDEVIETALSYFFSKESQIVLEELLFIDTNHIRHYMCFAGNKERLVGTIAKTFEKNIADWQTKNEEREIFQRRTLQMRTTQLLSSRQYTPLDTAIERIYANNFKLQKAATTTLNQAILEY